MFLCSPDQASIADVQSTGSAPQPKPYLQHPRRSATVRSVTLMHHRSSFTNSSSVVLLCPRDTDADWPREIDDDLLRDAEWRRETDGAASLLPSTSSTGVAASTGDSASVASTGDDASAGSAWSSGPSAGAASLGASAGASTSAGASSGASRLTSASLGASTSAGDSRSVGVSASRGASTSTGVDASMGVSSSAGADVSTWPKLAVSFFATLITSNSLQYASPDSATAQKLPVEQTSWAHGSVGAGTFVALLLGGATTMSSLSQKDTPSVVTQRLPVGQARVSQVSAAWAARTNPRTATVRNIVFSCIGLVVGVGRQ
eukprot:Rhum_TRINITY_DN14725_c2_g1::Rhum_TRINITY_DN14725_c2_g1_i1::g.113450::m.113450